MGEGTVEGQCCSKDQVSSGCRLSFSAGNASWWLRGRSVGVLGVSGEVLPEEYSLFRDSLMM